MLQSLAVSAVIAPSAGLLEATGLSVNYASCAGVSVAALASAGYKSSAHIGLCSIVAGIRFERIISWSLCVAAGPHIRAESGGEV